MSFLHIDGLRFHVQRMTPTDSGPIAGTVLLIHGIITDSLASWYFTISPALAAAGLDVVMYDHRGHGRSERPATGYHVERLVADCEEVLGQLDIAGPLHVLGNCFGGTAALSLAARRPELVASLFLVETEAATPEWAARMETIMADAVEATDKEETYVWLTEHRGEHAARLVRTSARILTTTSLPTDLPNSQLLGVADLAAIDCPVLAVYGAESVMVPQAPTLQAALPRCRSVFVPGLDHSVLADGPQAVRELALDWLAEQGVRLRRRQVGSVA